MKRHHYHDVSDALAFIFQRRWRINCSGDATKHSRRGIVCVCERSQSRPSVKLLPRQLSTFRFCGDLDVVNQIWRNRRRYLMLLCCFRLHSCISECFLLFVALNDDSQHSPLAPFGYFCPKGKNPRIEEILVCHATVCLNPPVARSTWYRFTSL